MRFKAAAVLVGSGIDQRREELVHQVAVGSVNFNQLEACFESTPGSVGESLGDAGDAFDGKCFRLNGFRGEAFGCGGVDGAPATLVNGNRLTGVTPRDIGGSLEAGMGELNSGNGSVLPEEANHPSEVFDVRVFPDSEVGGTDPSFRGDRGGFGKDRASATNGAGTEMNQMPVIAEAVLAGVLAHRGDGNAVTERNIADVKGIEQVHRIWMIPPAKRCRRAGEWREIEG